MKNNLQCYFKQNGIKYVDYKDTELLKKFLNPHSRILATKRTGVSSEYQRKLALAIKRARFMGLLPYISR
jgi:small subunit ribosomal protein S18